MTKDISYFTLSLSFFFSSFFFLELTVKLWLDLEKSSKLIKYYKTIFKYFMYILFYVYTFVF